VDFLNNLINDHAANEVVIPIIRLLATTLQVRPSSSKSLAFDRESTALLLDQFKIGSPSVEKVAGEALAYSICNFDRAKQWLLEHDLMGQLEDKAHRLLSMSLLFVASAI
jgi:hypothetical protein